MNGTWRALWKLAWWESRLLWCVLALLVFSFHWVMCFVVSQVSTEHLLQMINSLPEFIKRILPVEVNRMIQLDVRVSIAFDHPIVILACTSWAVSRGSDAVSGPLGRGTLEMVLSQPVTRRSVLLVNAILTTLGAFTLTVLGWLGTAVGLKTVPLLAEVSSVPYLYAAANLFAVTFFMAGVTTLLSACDRQRSRTIGLAAGFYIIAIIIKVVGRAIPSCNWATYLSFLSCFEPQKLIAEPENVVAMSLRYDGILLVLGLIAYAVAIQVFRRRDLPAPL